jgi:hypothetical protein
MSAESREMAKQKGQKSGKGSEILSKLLGRKDTESESDTNTDSTE